ncbi:Translation initiation factor 3 subunit J component [Malassezia nana]|uniref:Eukaryotic translation initiation factor 3 30 kDa subunit n=1 Tax=Malassezia nana TaxID=180528 RepID=A0AAF0EJK7_9BASI|nr:Translation initiation factor 3 subunit J component [Malassezia nana]
MSDWENDDVGPAPVPLPGRRRFEDEDVEEDDIKDDWEEEDEPEPKPAPAPEPKKRLSVKQKIAEKEAQRQKESNNDFDDWDLEGEEEDEDERRRQEKEAQMRSDLDNAAALLGASSLEKGAAGAPASLLEAKPTNKEEWEAFAAELYQTVVQPQANRPGFDKYFFPRLLTLLTTHGLRDVDMRKGATKLRELAEAKVRADKEAKKTGGNVKRPAAKPKQVGTSSAKNTIDLKAYGDEALDDDLEFM